MNLDLTGKHALVCGGSQGIGHAAAIELAQLGASVTLLARSPTHSKPPRRAAAHAAGHATLAADIADMRAAREVAARPRRSRPHPRQQHRRPARAAPRTTPKPPLLAAFQQPSGANQVLQAVLPGMQAAHGAASST